jgi:hypothetical protein
MARLGADHQTIVFNRHDARMVASIMTYVLEQQDVLDEGMATLEKLKNKPKRELLNLDTDE